MTTDNSADGPEIELTNPDEYISEQCSNAVVNGMEFSVPCTYEDLTDLFVLKPVGEKVSFKDEGFYVQAYNMFTEDDQYIGMADIVNFNDGSSVTSALESIYVLNYTEGQSSLAVGGIEAGRTTRSEIEARPGEGYDPLADRGLDGGDIGYTYAEYTFEDGTLSVVYSKDTVVNCRAWFDPLKNL